MKQAIVTAFLLVFIAVPIYAQVDFEQGFLPFQSYHINDF